MSSLFLNRRSEVQSSRERQWNQRLLSKGPPLAMAHMIVRYTSGRTTRREQRNCRPHGGERVPTGETTLDFVGQHHVTFCVAGVALSCTTTQFQRGLVVE